MSDEAPASEPCHTLDVLENRLAYRFNDRRLLEHSLTHSSFAHEERGVESNERLEFLGDAVIGIVVAHLLYEAHPAWREGELTRGLHRLVDRQALWELACSLDLGIFLKLGRTERRSGGEHKMSILADAMEAVLGAMYLDGGLEPVTTFARNAFASALAADAPRVGRDPKTHFQEWIMSKFGEFPSYRGLTDSEIEGDDERFYVEVHVQDEVWGQGRGRTKRAAERMAAEAGLFRASREDD